VPGDQKTFVLRPSSRTGLGFAEVEPWPEPVDTDYLLHDISTITQAIRSDNGEGRVKSSISGSLIPFRLSALEFAQ
jgi:hypothetical protein